MSNIKQIHIQHARNGGEKKIGEYLVDGYHVYTNGVKTVFEYHGCFWHGCVNCFSRHTVNPVNQMTMADLYQRTLEKKHYLESLGYHYISTWECEFDREISDNPDIKSFVDRLIM